MRRTGGRIVIGVLAVAGLYLFSPAFATTEYEHPDHARLADELRHCCPFFTETIFAARDDILRRVDARSDQMEKVYTETLRGARDDILKRLNDRADELGNEISGTVFGARDTLLSRLDARADDLGIYISSTVFGARDTLLSKLNDRVDDLGIHISSTVFGARNTILSRLEGSEMQLSNLVADLTRPATMLARRTNTYRNWLFTAGATAPDQMLSFTLFSDVAQTVKVVFYTDTGIIGPIDLPLKAQHPFVLRANEVLGVRNAVTTRFSGDNAFHVERTFTTRGAVAITSGEHD